MKKVITTTLLAITICLWGCKKDDTIINPTSANIPVIASTTNAFTYTLVANSFTSTTTYNVAFSTDSLACSTTVTNQTSGNASLKISDSTSAIVYSDSSLTNKVLAFTQAHKGIPKTIQVTFTNYTGTLVFALSRNR
jgi:serine protease inhibitor